MPLGGKNTRIHEQKMNNSNPQAKKKLNLIDNQSCILTQSYNNFI